MISDKIIELYSSKYSAYEALAQRTASLLEALARASQISVHVIERRVKSIDSVAEKIRRPGKSYSSLEDITDLAGVRVICYYQDDCDRISKIIEQEFKIEESEDSHSAKNLSEDRFGYLSLHKIVKPSMERSCLIEWQDVSNLCCEIQVRTVIQHAWAAVSHQVQYKAESKIPSLLKRRLNRIAGLFELSDEQFMQVRDERERIASDAQSLIDKDDLSFDISPSSVRIVINKWDKDYSVKDQIRSIGYSVFDDSDPLFDGDDGVVSGIIELSQGNDISSASDLLGIAGKFDEAYMNKQFKASGESWSISTPFAFLLHMIKNAKIRPTILDLVNQGWGDEIAKRVLKVAREK